MLKNITIENFRSFEDIRINKLKRLNIITGRNGGGKTSLLECVWLNCSGANAPAILSISDFRGDNVYHNASDTQFRSIFYDLDPKNIIRITANEVSSLKSKTRSLRIEPILKSQVLFGRSSSEVVISGLRFRFGNSSRESASQIELNQLNPTNIQGSNGQNQIVPFAITHPTENEPVWCQFISPYKRDVFQEIYDQLVDVTKNKQLDTLIGYLKIIEPNIKTVSPLMEGGVPAIYVDIGKDRLRPVSTLGSGFLHVLRIVLTITYLQEGIIIIDELEDGLHYSIMPQVVEAIIRSTHKSKVQFFISTHSNELLDVFTKTIEDENFEDVCLINVINSEGKTTIRYFDNTEIEFAKDIGAELR